MDVMHGMYSLRLSSFMSINHLQIAHSVLCVSRSWHIQSYLLSTCSHSVCGMHFLLMSASCRQTAQGSSVHYHTYVDAFRPCFYPLHHAVFIRFVCSAVWHHCFHVVHLDQSQRCDIARRPSWHLPVRSYHAVLSTNNTLTLQTGPALSTWNWCLQI